MNHRGGWALIRSTWASWMQYRSFFFVLAFGWMVPPLVAMFVWITAAGEGTVGGITRSQFITYYLVLMLVNQFTYAQANWTLGDMIREGVLNHWLLRPLAPVYHVLASEVAGKIVYLIFTVPFVLLLALILHPQFNLNLINGLLFLLSLIFAWALRFLWGFLAGLSCILVNPRRCLPGTAGLAGLHFFRYGCTAGCVTACIKNRCNHFTVPLYGRFSG